MSAEAQANTRREFDLPFAIVVVAAAIALAAGLVVRLGELSEGVDAGTTDRIAWGLLVVNYVAFIGLSAGGVIIASLVYILNLKRFKSIATFAELLAVISILLVPFFIAFDLGRPERAINLVLFGRIESPLVWTVIVLTTYLVVCITYLYYGVRRELLALAERPGRLQWLYRLTLFGYRDASEASFERDARLVRRMSYVVLPLAIALHSITGLIFAVVGARPGYHTAIMPPLFVVSAVLSGIALVTFVIVVAGKRVKLPVEPGTVEELGKIMAILLPVLAYLLLMEWTVVFYGANPGPLNVWSFIATGAYAPLFWALVVLGLVVPFALLAHPRWRTRRTVGIASGLIVFGVFLERYLIVITPLLFPTLPGSIQLFAPSTSEFLMVAGGYGLGVLLVALATKLFPVGVMYDQLRHGKPERPGGAGSGGIVGPSAREK
ncbi:MAG: hypothetical protein A3K68_02595 [Euryarchaeota archaeon RBG_16_68_13]|nr:MAG: hypothetical protein A3K68_02595 [Euryarchaeota archaeon RBG_16_68_13]